MKEHTIKDQVDNETEIEVGIRVGNVVALKSVWRDNGVKMTVELVNLNTETVHCVWFDKNDDLQRNTFKMNTLYKITF